MILLFSPAMQIIPTPELAVERFLYPVLPGAALLLAAFLIRRPGDLLRHIASPFARPTIDPLRLLALLILVLCIARTLDRNRDWHDDLTLNIRAYEQWEGAEGKFRLGTLLLSDGQIDRARETLEEVVRIDPGHPAAWRNLGLLYWKMGRADDAEKAIRKSTEIEPEDEKNREALKWIERSSQ
ncbi:tetratricopeptide repeat protein [bacterium]|nr:tetratricopeptide repeat protein [bacterium]